MTARLVRQLALELLERSRLVSAREADQSEQPVQGDAAEARGTAGLRTLAGNAQRQLALGVAERLAGDVYRRGQPVRERKTGEQRERTSGFTEPLLAPAGIGESDTMPPIVAFQRDRPPQCGKSIGMCPGAIEHEAEGGPRLAVPGIESTGLAGMLERLLQRLHVRRRIGARHFELHGARVREADLRRRLSGDLGQDALEHLSGVDDLIAFERFQRRAAFNPHAVRRQERVERIIGFAGLEARDVGSEAVAAARVGLDILRAEEPTQTGDRLLETVVGDGDVGPGGLNQQVF